MLERLNQWILNFLACGPLQKSTVLLGALAMFQMSVSALQPPAFMCIYNLHAGNLKKSQNSTKTFLRLSEVEKEKDLMCVER